MPSEKVTRILISKTDLSESDIDKLTDAEAWRIVYSQPKTVARTAHRVCFTGFRSKDKAALSEAAVDFGMKEVKSVTQNLAFLVCGSNAGPVKMNDAEDVGALVLSRLQFEAMGETGEIPDDVEGTAMLLSRRRPRPEFNYVEEQKSGGYTFRATIVDDDDELRPKEKTAFFLFVLAIIAAIGYYPFKFMQWLLS